jgi:hypothetical protein
MHTDAEIAAIKAAVRKRDGDRCVECQMPAEQHQATYGRGLDVHRIEPGSLYSLDGCVTLCRPCHARYRRPQSPTNSLDLERSGPITVGVRLPQHLHRMARLISGWYNKRLADYITTLLEPLLKRDYAALMAECRAEREADMGEEKDGGPKP